MSWLDRSMREPRVLIPAVLAVVALIFVLALLVGNGGGTFADDMNHACADHNGVFSFNSGDGSGVCRDGTAVAP